MAGVTEISGPVSIKILYHEFLSLMKRRLAFQPTTSAVWSGRFFSLNFFLKLHGGMQRFVSLETMVVPT